MTITNGELTTMLVLVLSLRKDMVDNNCDGKHKRRVGARLHMHNVFVRNALKIFRDAIAVVTRNARNFLLREKEEDLTRGIVWKKKRKRNKGEKEEER